MIIFKRHILISVILILTAYCFYGNVTLPDSVYTKIESFNADSNKVKYLNSLVFKYNYSNGEEALQLADKSINLSKEINFKKGLAKAYNLKGIIYRNFGMLDSSEAYCRRSLIISEENNFLNCFASASNNMGSIYYYKGDFSESLSWYKKATLHYSKLNKPQYEAVILNNIGLVYNEISDYPMALEYYFKALKIQEEQGYKEGEGMALNSIGMVYSDQQEFEKALFYYRKSLNIRSEIDDYFGIAQLWNNMANVYLQQNGFDSALVCYEKALEIFRDKNDMQNGSISLQGTAIIYQHNKQYNKAIQTLEEALNYSILYGNHDNTASNYFSLGHMYFELNQYDKSLDYLRKSVELSLKTGNLNSTGEAYLSMSKAYERMGDFKMALNYYQQFFALHDSIFSERSAQRIADAEIRFQTEKKDAQLDLLSRENALRSSQLRNTKLFRNSLIIIAILILAITIILFFRYRANKKYNTILNDKNKSLERSKDQIEQQKIEIEQQSEQLMELDKAKSKFFANISHEFRTPLMLIRGPLDDLLNNQHLDDGEISNLNIAKRNIQKLDNLISQLLDISKLDSGKLKLRASKSDIVTFIRRIVDTFASAGKKIDFSIKTINKIPLIYFDDDKMEKILNNLLSNAYKFVDENGKIDIIIKGSANNENASTGSFIDVSVKDNGPGINPDSLLKIFDRYYQSEEAIKYSYEGTGIGLSLTKELVELHGGQISVKSKPGEGSEFTFSIPVGRDQLQDDEIVDKDEIIKSTTPDIEPQSIESYNEYSEISGNHQVLVVEDNPDMRNYIVSHLSDQYAVLEASNGRDGYEIILNQKPDIIITDLMMPVMDGLELLNKIRKTDTIKDIPVIMLTARADESDKIIGLKAKANDYLTKPFSSEELIARIRNILENRELLKGKYSKKVIAIEFDNPEMVSADRGFLNKMKSAVIDNISNSDFDVTLLSEAAFLSERQLRRRLKELTGLSPLDFIRQIRLLQAKELLEKRAYNSISEISAAVGFNNPNYFSRLYKKMFGISPGEFYH